jgi:ubiquinone/menaquinone biosynthesis C-methylase UbiE
MESLYTKIIADESQLKGVAYYFCNTINVKQKQLEAPPKSITESLVADNIISGIDFKVIDREFGYACFEHYRQNFSLNILDQILFNEGRNKSVIVDLCCGPGATIRQLLAHSPEVIYGVDSNERYISLIKQMISEYPELKTEVNLIKGDANTIPLSSSTIDYVVCRVALQYLDIESVLSEVNRVLKKGGRFIAIVHGSGYIFDYLFNRRKMFDKQTVKYFNNVFKKKQTIQQSRFLTENRLIKSMKDTGFSKVEIIKEKNLMFLGLFPIYFAIIGEKAVVKASN